MSMTEIADNSIQRDPNPFTLSTGEIKALDQQSFANLLSGLDPAFERVLCMTAIPQQQEFLIVAVIGNERTGSLSPVSCRVGTEYDSFTPGCPQVHMFEREMHEQTGVKPNGHPWLKPVRFEKGEPHCGDVDYFQVEGDDVHEVAVGPIHAGVIEPGHFRFQCHGETVFHLEISLGYQHRGIESALRGGPAKRTLPLMETAAGDTTVGHALAYCQLIEALAGIEVPARGQAIRAVALELERLANHIGDLGALANDVGYLPTSSFCGRIRGDFLNMTAQICGSRFGRGLIVPGGTKFDVDEKLLSGLRNSLQKGEKDSRVAIQLMLARPSVVSRFEHTGRITRETGWDLSLVGPAARACGKRRDVRSDFPSGYFRQHPVDVAHEISSGCVMGRAKVRWIEVQNSLRFISGVLENLPEGEVKASESKNIEMRLSPDALAVSLVEGWRGEICHMAVTDAHGRFSIYKLVDPSFHNWTGLAMALRNQEISDFPLCNKSFNLSYCGFDL